MVVFLPESSSYATYQTYSVFYISIQFMYTLFCFLGSFFPLFPFPLLFHLYTCSFGGFLSKIFDCIQPVIFSYCLCLVVSFLDCRILSIVLIVSFYLLSSSTSLMVMSLESLFVQKITLRELFYCCFLVCEYSHKIYYLVMTYV